MQPCALHYSGEKDTMLSLCMQSLTSAWEAGLCLNKPGFHRRLLYLANLLLCSAAILEDEDGERKKENKKKAANRTVKALTKEHTRRRKRGNVTAGQVYTVVLMVLLQGTLSVKRIEKTMCVRKCLGTLFCRNQSFNKGNIGSAFPSQGCQYICHLESLSS